MNNNKEILNKFNETKEHNLIPIIGKKNQIIGFESKEKIHKKGLFHRAVSVFIFNKKNDLMIQKRSHKKYHSSLLWTNTCCSHPKKYESLINAAHRCLLQEMGFDCFLEQKFFFIYHELLKNGLIEYELDHVFIGNYNKYPIINKEEVDNWKWISLKKLIKSIRIFPHLYTIWFKIIINNYIDKLMN
ncbi:isopentenyl-diphosphate Delta-isomerase [Blattabacterium cuenoti]|uniref:isopentenyl-diphosphate Delta-isomerase n=1 Tax=Blattabacterium cuenoti TaxID=1653831 RepID=UPI00163C0163|nr:NUDIX domain-containing protein [Blattabacterium cuenoti]